MWKHSGHCLLVCVRADQSDQTGLFELEVLKRQAPKTEHAHRGWIEVLQQWTEWKKWCFCWTLKHVNLNDCSTLHHSVSDLIWCTGLSIPDWRNQITALHTTCQHKSVATSQQPCQCLEMTSWRREHHGLNCVAEPILHLHVKSLLPEVHLRHKPATITFNATTWSSWQERVRKERAIHLNRRAVKWFGEKL